MTKQPTFFATEDQAFNAFAEVTSTRSRPVLASRTVKGKKEFIVCCKTTAKKHEWNLEGKLYAKSLNRVGREAVAEAKADQPKAAKKAAKRLATLDEMLGLPTNGGKVEFIKGQGFVTSKK